MKIKTKKNVRAGAFYHFQVVNYHGKGNSASAGGC